MAIPDNAGAIADATANRLTECDADVFHCVMGSIAASPVQLLVEIKPAVSAKHRERAWSKKGHTGSGGNDAGAVEIRLSLISVSDVERSISWTNECVRQLQSCWTSFVPQQITVEFVEKGFRFPPAFQS